MVIEWAGGLLRQAIRGSLGVGGSGENQAGVEFSTYHCAEAHYSRSLYSNHILEVFFGVQLALHLSLHFLKQLID
jgi:hypothetical protein